MLDHKQLRRAVREAQARELVDLAELVAPAARPRSARAARASSADHRHRPGADALELEDVVLDLLLGGGIAHPDVNVPLRDRRAGESIPDFRWPEQRLVVEADGAAWHDNPLAREDDAERQALLEAARRAGAARDAGSRPWRAARRRCGGSALQAPAR